jgi:hypothetical protein
LKITPPPTSSIRSPSRSPLRSFAHDGRPARHGIQGGHRRHPASLSYKFKKALASLAETVMTTDPFVTTDPFTTDPKLLPLDDVISRSDLLILCAPHSAYRQLDLAGKPVVDVWGFFQNANVIS